MCRNIKKLRKDGTLQPTDAELRDAALQFIRKISGYRSPSKANEEAFETAVADVTQAARRLFHSLTIRESHRRAI